MSWSLPDYYSKKIVRVDFDPQAHRNLIATRGLQVKWEAAHLCPCETERKLNFTGATASLVAEPDATCSSCNGTGWIYHSAQTVWAQVLGMDVMPDLFAMYGTMALGMMRLTTQPQHFLEARDRVTVLDARRRYTERQTRTSDVVSLTFPVQSFSVTTGQALDPNTPQTQTLDMLHVTAADTNGDVILDGSAPREYVKGTDFTIDGSGRVDWTGGANVPPSGAVVSYTYLCLPVYLVHNVPFVSRQSYVKNKTPAPVLQRLPNHADCKLAGDSFPGVAAV